MSVTAHLPALQVVVPMLTAPVLVLLRDARLCWIAALLTSATSFAIAVALAAGVLDGMDIRYAMGNWAAPYGIELRVDALSAILLLATTGASTLALLGGRRSLLREIGDARLPLFLAAWLLALAGLVGILVSGDAFNIFVFMEISSLATYILVSGGPHRRALPAVFKYLITGTVGATFYLIGVGLLYMMTGTLNIEDMAARLGDVGASDLLYIAIGFIAIGLALKAAIYPLHAWMPNAYTFAPHMVTVFIAACSTKVSLYVLLRMDYAVFQHNLPEQGLHFALILMPLASLGIVFGSLAAIFEQNIKRILALSSVAQLGYILLGASLVSAAGINASALHLFNHALAKGALFLAVACLGYRFAKLRLEDLRGAGRLMPWTLTAFALAGLSLIGIPGTAGFVSKWALILALMEQGALGVALVVLVVVSSLMAVVYIGRIVETLWFAEPPGEDPTVKEAPVMLLAVTWLAVALNFWFGFDASTSGALAIQAATDLTGSAP
ncbi:MAG: monovalent cation/H+ antiporter subunit D family protein [Xanthomonadales bacterium]|jgi:multicomponent Na+:H+ antiporter subunit D|nr:monovalent cation/H+ antiporter subunit D family protein [Xanthomonadales bacterium]